MNRQSSVYWITLAVPILSPNRIPIASIRFVISVSANAGPPTRDGPCFKFSLAPRIGYRRFRRSTTSPPSANKEPVAGSGIITPPVM